MAALPPAPERRRPRPGSLERPINGRLYRGTWLLVGLPLLVLAFSVARPARSSRRRTCPRPSTRTPRARSPPTSPTSWPNRVPGTPGRDRGRPLVHRAARALRLPGAAGALHRRRPGPRPRRASSTCSPSGPAARRRRSSLMAHRDDAGSGAGRERQRLGHGGAARARARLCTGRRNDPCCRCRTRSRFLSTDGAADGGLGAAWFAAHARRGAERDRRRSTSTRSRARGRPRLELGGDTPRSPAPGPRRDRPRAARGRDRHRSRRAPSALRQLVDLGFPYSRYEQAPFVTRGIPAVTITTAADRPAAGSTTSRSRSTPRASGRSAGRPRTRSTRCSRASRSSPGPSSYVYLGSRVVRGWAIELVLIGALLPFLAATVDLFARCRRRRIRVAPALRSYRSRLGFWLWCGALFGLFALLGAWGERRARGRRRSTGVHWPAGALLGLAALAGLGWIVARDRLLPRRPVRAEEEIAGHTGALLALERRRAPRRRDEPVRARLPPALAARLALAATGAPRARPLGAALVLLAGFAGPGAPRSGPSPAATASAGTRRGTSRRSSRSAMRRCRRFVDRARLGRGGGPARRARGRPLRAVSVRGGAPAARAAARVRAPPRARAAAAARIRTGTARVTGLRCTASHGSAAPSCSAPASSRSCWALARLAMAGPVHGALHALAAAQLAQSLDRELAAYRPVERGRRTSRPSGARSRSTRSAFGARREPGQAIGRIEISRIGLHMVLVDGTDHESLKKGPGRDARSAMPGQNRLVYIAGHRTTYLAPFSHIDAIRPGDAITLADAVRDVHLSRVHPPRRRRRPTCRF